MPFQDLGDVKANSINEWVAIPAVQRSIVRNFKEFLLNYVDENGKSVYGPRVRVLGEGQSPLVPSRSRCYLAKSGLSS